MANFANKSDAISVLRGDIAAFVTAYRQLAADIGSEVDFDYFTGTLTAGGAPLVDADFTGLNADYTAANFRADLVSLNDILALFTGTRRKALSRLSPR